MLTAGKDGNVTLAHLTDNAIVHQRTFAVSVSKIFCFCIDSNSLQQTVSFSPKQSLHSSVVKSVRWQPSSSTAPTIFASTGNDNSLVVCDVREPDATSGLRCDNAHTASINTVSVFVNDSNLLYIVISCTVCIEIQLKRCKVRWHPSEPLLLSTSFSSSLLVHDTRRFDRPLFTLVGHTGSSYDGTQTGWQCPLADSFSFSISRNIRSVSNEIQFIKRRLRWAAPRF